MARLQSWESIPTPCAPECGSWVSIGLGFEQGCLDNVAAGQTFARIRKQCERDIPSRRRAIGDHPLPQDSMTRSVGQRKLDVCPMSRTGETPNNESHSLFGANVFEV